MKLAFALFYFSLALLGACYDPNNLPPCDPSTIDYPRCLDPTLPSKAKQAQGGQGGHAQSFGASIIYPGRNTSSTYIADSTATGRSLLTCATAAACRAVLGISNIDETCSAGIALANSLISFTYTPQAFCSDGYAAMGSTGSRWNNILSGSAARTVVTSPTAQERGGATQYTTGATASSQAQWLSIPNGLGVFATGVADDLTSATSKWFMQWDFSYQTTPDAQSSMGLGWIDPAGTATMFFGVQGSGSTSFFRFFRTGVAGTSSTVSIDTKRHRVRLWHDGGVATGTINWSIDGVAQTPITGISWGTAAGPYGTILNGTTAAAQTVRLFSSVYVVDGVQNPPP